jgi:hypothetical protein
VMDIDTRNDILQARMEARARSQAKRKYNDACCYARKNGLPLPEPPDLDDDGIQDEATIQERIRLLREGKL